jgi:hypothetical protein
MSNYYQLSLFDINKDFREFLTDDSTNYFELFRNFISFSKIIPNSFYQYYCQDTGRNRKFSLESMFMFFIYKNFCSISRDSALLKILKYSPNLRLALGFICLSHLFQFSRFKITFLNQIHLILDNLVNIVNLEFIKIVSDSSGFEGYVTKNNSKFFEFLLKTSENYAKSGRVNDIFVILQLSD